MTEHQCVISVQHCPEIWIVKLERHGTNINAAAKYQGDQPNELSRMRTENGSGPVELSNMTATQSPHGAGGSPYVDDEAPSVVRREPAPLSPPDGAGLFLQVAARLDGLE